MITAQELQLLVVKVNLRARENRPNCHNQTDKMFDLLKFLAKIAD